MARWLVVLGVIVVVVAAVFVLLGDDGLGSLGTSSTRTPAVVDPEAADDERADPGLVPAAPDRGQSPLESEAVVAGDGPPADVEAAPVGPRVVVTGRLVSPDGRPVEAATVHLLDGPAAQLQLLTAGSGAGAETRAGSGRDGATDARDGASRGGTSAEPAATRDGDVVFALDTSISDGEGRFRLEAEASSPGPEARAVPAFLEDVVDPGPRLIVLRDGFQSTEHGLPPLEEGELDAGTIVLPPAAAIVGRVLSAGGRPVAGAGVGVRRDEPRDGGLAGLFQSMLGTVGEALSTARSGPDGRFRLEGLAPGTVGVVVSAEGHRAWRREGLVLSPGPALDLGDILLEEGGLVAGVVRDQAGAPVPGVVVEVHTVMEELAELRTHLRVGGGTRHAVTGAGGRFVVRGLEEGVHDVEAVADEHWSGAEERGVASGRNDVVLTVHRLSELLVRAVSTEDGTGLDALRVAATALPDGERELPVSAWRGREGRQWAAGATSDGRATAPPPLPGAAWPDDPTGWILVEGVGRDGARLEVDAPGHGVVVLEAGPVPRPARYELTVPLAAEASVSGLVVDDAEAPVPSARIEATLDAAETAGPPGTVTASAGTLRTDLDISRRRPGAQAPAVEVTATSDADGRFRLERLSAGSWTLAAAPPSDGDPDLLPSEPLGVTLEEGEARGGVVLALAAGGAVVGTVRDADGNPVEGARVAVEAVGGGPGTMEERVAEGLVRSLVLSLGVAEQVETGGDGRYAVRGLAPGDWRVTLVERDAAPALDVGALLLGTTPEADQARSRTVRVEARRETVADFARSPRAALEVMVVAGGRPVSGARVALSRGAGSLLGLDLGLGARIRRTGPEGRVHYDDLSPGAWTVRAAVDGATGLAERAVELAPRELGQVELVFGTGLIEGRVTDGRTGAPAPGVPIAVQPVEEASQEEDDDGGLLGGLLGNVNVSVDIDGVEARGRGDGVLGGLAPDEVTSDEAGRFVLRHLAPGAWVVEAGGGVWLADRSEPVEVDGIRPATVALTVRRGSTLSGRIVQGTTEEPLHDVEVRLRSPGEGGDRTTRSVHGTWRVEGVAPGTWIVTVGEDGERAERRVEVPDDGRDMTVHLVTSD